MPILNKKALFLLSSLEFKEMSILTDPDTLFSIYDSLQNLMRLNQDIDSMFKELENKKKLRCSLEQIENNSLEIIDICESIQTTLKPDSYCACTYRYICMYIYTYFAY